MPTALLTPNAEADPLEILDDSVDGFTLSREGNDDLFGLFTQFEDEWASSPDSEGAFPVRSKPNNIERPGRVLILGDAEADLEAKVLLWQQTIMAIRRNGGTLVYTTRTGEQITFEIYRASILEVGQNPHYRLGGTAESSFVLTCAPYALLPSSTVNITAEIGTQTNATTVTSTEPLLSFIAPDPGGSVPARVKLTVTDQEGVDRSHLEGGVDPNYDSDDPAPLFFDTNPAITLSTSAAADDIIDTASAHGFSAGDKVRFLTLTGGTNLSTGVVYYVIAANLAAQTFQVSTTSGGSAVDFSSNITAGTVIAADNLGPLAGTSNTSLTGEYGSETIRATLTTTAVAICGSGPQVHQGSYRHKPRLWGAGTGPIWVQLQYKVGSSPQWRETDWVQLPGLSAWYELDIGLMEIMEPVQGTQSCEFRIVAYSETPGDTLDVDYDLLVPAGPYFKARTPLEIVTSTTFSAWSDFTTESGVITGDSLRVGGTWVGTGLSGGGTTDYSVASGVATRTAISDAGRLITASTPTLTDTVVQVDAKTNARGDPDLGVVARFVDGLNYLSARVKVRTTDAQLFVMSEVGGASTSLADPEVVWDVDVFYSIRLFVDAAGRYAVWFWRTGVEPGSPIAIGQSSVLATGGTLASGGVGIRDRQNVAAAATRTYDNFVAWVPAADHVFYTDGAAEVRSDQVLREHSTGEWGRIDSTGGYPTLPPGRTSRIALKARQNDTDQLPDDVIDDSISAQLEITPRVALL